MIMPAITPGGPHWFVHDFRKVSSAPSVRDITVSCDHPATITVCTMDRALTAEPAEALANAKAIAAVPAMLEALRRLSFAAQTSGGTAGRDDDLVAAIDEAVAALRLAGAGE